MDSVADIEEAINAVLQDAVLAAEPSISTLQDTQTDVIAVSNEPDAEPPWDRQPSTADQLSRHSSTSEGQPADSSQNAGPSSHISPVSSAINPLFQPSQPNRPQSAQIQQTLTSLTKQLSDLEASMQSPRTTDFAAAETISLSGRPGKL